MIRSRKTEDCWIAKLTMLRTLADALGVTISELMKRVWWQAARLIFVDPGRQRSGIDPNKALREE